MTDEEARDRRSTKTTVALDPRELAQAPGTWPVAVAILERTSTWGTYALRLGMLALLQELVRIMAEPGAGPECVVRAQEILDALRHMPWEPPIIK